MIQPLRLGVGVRGGELRLTLHILVHSTLFLTHLSSHLPSSAHLQNGRLYAERIKERCLLFLKENCFRKQEVGEEEKRDQLL